MRLFNQFLWRNVAQRAVQRLVDACKRVNQDIVRDHEGILRSLRLLQIESEVQTVQSEIKAKRGDLLATLYCSAQLKPCKTELVPDVSIVSVVPIVADVPFFKVL